MRRRGFTAAVALGLVSSLAVAFTSGAAPTASTPKPSRACIREISLNDASPPQLLQTPPPASLTSILEVLRRPGTSVDHLPASAVPHLGYSMLWPGSARLLAVGPEHTRYFLLPGVVALPLPTPCFEAVSPTSREKLETEEREQQQGSVSVEVIRGEELIGQLLFAAEAVQSGRAVSTGLGRSGSKTSVFGVVPDGIASVRISGGGISGLTVPASNNFFLTSVPVRNQQSFEFELLAANGTLVKSSNVTERVIEIGGSGPTSIPIKPPAALKRAGGRELVEYKRGRAVMAQSGCLACHRIGDVGNKGPGPDLTHVGSKLSRSAIEHALDDPTAPMPSFKHLPATKFKDLVRFVAELR